MKISLIMPIGGIQEGKSNFLIHLYDELRQLRHDVIINDCDETCDVIISMSISQMPITKLAHKQYPNIPLFCYNWDIYEWVWNSSPEQLASLGSITYDYKGYGELLAECKEVWCPSECTVKRMKEWFNLDNGVVIKTFSLFFDDKIIDNRFVFNPLRSIPDRNLGWFERACNELDIPFVARGSDAVDWREHKRRISRCSFLVSPYYEASTGGLTLIEGTYLGKPCLVSDSPYCGARDYLGDRAWYFKHDSYEDLKKKIKELWDNTPQLDVKECQQWVKDNYSPSVMAEEINKRLLKL
jgi:glycosyltransferase involved in cell wall biosynthesis